MARTDDHLIRFDVDVFEKALDSFVDETEKIVRKAIYSTIARLRRKAKTEISAKIREKYNIKKQDLDGYIRVSVGSRGRAYETFEMTIKGATLSLAKFGVKQVSGSRVTTRRQSKTLKRRGRSQGLTVEVIKGKPVRLKRSWLHVSGTHMMVLRRKGESRYPISLRVVVSPATIFENEQYWEWFEDFVMDFIEKEFPRQLDFRLQQAGFL